MTEMKAELNAAPIYDWHAVPITENHHRWLLDWQKTGDDGEFFFVFVSPKKRKYAFWAECGENGGRVVSAEVSAANGVTTASYDESWGDKPERMDAVLRLTPKHILDRLFVLLDAIG